MLLVKLDNEFHNARTVYTAINMIAKHIKANDDWRSHSLTIWDQDASHMVGYKNFEDNFVFQGKTIDESKGYTHWLMDCLHNDFD